MNRRVRRRVDRVVHVGRWTLRVDVAMGSAYQNAWFGS